MSLDINLNREPGGTCISNEAISGVGVGVAGFAQSPFTVQGVPLASTVNNPMSSDSISVPSCTHTVLFAPDGTVNEVRLPSEHLTYWNIILLSPDSL